jgi:polyhydroxybutyrate depolymerase
MTHRKRKALRIVLITFFSIIGFLLVVILAGYILLRIEMNRTNGELISSGEKRTYLLYVPPGYDPAKPVPLVVNIHGFAQWPRNQMQVSGWNEVADQFNFIVVYPKGRGFPLRWTNNGQAGTDEDIRFFSDLFDKLSAEYNINPQRIYVSGLSNGGGMSFALACRLSDRIAAFGSVAGAYALPWSDCNPSRLVPAIIFHGTADPIVPFTGGAESHAGLILPDITQWVSRLAQKNGCNPAPTELPAQGEVREVKYTVCAQGADVDFYIIDGGGHSWPGGGYLPAWIVGHTTQDINATRVMWDFFQQHPLGK